MIGDYKIVQFRIASWVFTCKTQFYKWLITYDFFGICFGIEGVHIDSLRLDSELA
jgi:hypothetical protein